MQTVKEVLEARAPLRVMPTVSAVFEDGAILEMVHDVEARRTHFVLWRDGAWEFKDSYQMDAAQRLVPYSASNNLIRNEIVLLASGPEEYSTEDALISDIRRFIRRYVDVSPLYEAVAGYYVLLSWVYDGFNELPYLRVRGDPGTGKTRFLLTIGSLCYKAIFASGASTVSPVFRMLETFRGTLVIDESDFRFSDEKAEMVKILNNGNARGFPVLRSETNSRGEYNPRAYHVFGPKVLATRGDFDDRALESRFLTEEMGSIQLRDDIPINLPPEHKAEALSLRNRLLLFRFRNLHKRRVLADLVDRSLEPRLNQILVPLLSIIEDANAREQMWAFAQRYQREQIVERGQDIEALVLEVIQELLALAPDGRLSIKEIAARFAELHEGDCHYKVTGKWIGTVVRKRLHLKTVKSHGVFVIPPTEGPKLDGLFIKYGLKDRRPPLPEVPMSPSQQSVPERGVPGRGTSVG